MDQMILLVEHDNWLGHRDQDVFDALFGCEQLSGPLAYAVLKLSRVLLGTLEQAGVLDRSSRGISEGLQARDDPGIKEIHFVRIHVQETDDRSEERRVGKECRSRW